MGTGGGGVRSDDIVAVTHSNQRYAGGPREGSNFAALPQQRSKGRNVARLAGHAGNKIVPADGALQTVSLPVR